MGWNFPWTESIKKRISKYFLQRYLGSFLREKLTLDQLSVDIYNGTGSVHDLHLDVEKINETLENVGAPVELVDGFVRRVTMSVPWSGLLSHSTSLEVEGLELTLRPNPKCAGGEMDISRLPQSMTSSLQLAQDCLSSTGADAMLPPAPASSSSVDEGTLPEGLEAFVKTIDFVLEHIRVTFLDTVARLESMLSTSKGVALEVRIKRAEYFDDAAASESSAQSSASAAGSGSSQGRSAHTFSSAAFVTKNIHLSGIALFTDEFCTNAESTPNVDLLSEQSSSAVFHSFGSRSSYHSTHASLSSVASADPQGEQMPHSKPVQFAALLGEQRLKLRLKLNEQVAGPFVAVEIRLGTAGIFSSPRQVHAILLLLGQLSPPSAAATEGSPDSEEWTEAQPSLPHRLHTYQDSHGTSGGTVDAHMLHSINIQDDSWSYGLHHQPHILHLDRATTDSHMFLSARMDNVDLESSASAWDSQSSSSQSSTAAVGYGRHPRGGGEHAAPSSSSAVRLTVTAELAFILAVLVHDNLTQSCDGLADLAGSESCAELELASQRFFSGFAGQRTKGVADLKVIRAETIDYCQGDHLKLIAKSFKLEVKQQQHYSSTAGGASLASSNISATIGNCEITEWVDSRPRVKGYEARPSHSELLTFIPRDAAFTNAGTMAQSIYETSSGSSGCIKISMTSSTRQSSRKRRHRRQRRFKVDAMQTVINIQLLRSFHIEVDVSLFDRLYNLRTPPPAFSRGSSQKPHELYMDDSRSDPVAFVLSTECDGDIILRFPIADLRGRNGEAGAAERLPWQWRHLRPEALRLHVSEPSIKAMLVTLESPASRASDNASSSVEIQFADVTCSLLTDGGSEERDIFCAHKDFVTSTQPVDSHEPCRPSIVLSWKPKQPASVFQPLSPGNKSPADSSSRTDSLSDIMQIEVQLPSPFSGQQTLHKEAAQRVIAPGTRRELKTFTNTFSSSANFRIGIHIPAADIVLCDHRTLELVYNRLCNDLLMWEPLSPSGPENDAPGEQLFGGGDGWHAARQVAQAFAANICMNPAMYAAAGSHGVSPMGSFPQGAAGPSHGCSVDDCSSVGGSSSCTSLTSTDSRLPPARPGQVKSTETCCKTAIQLVVDRATVLICHSTSTASTESQISGLSSSTACFPSKVDYLPVTLAEITGCSIFLASEASGDPNCQLCSVQLHQFTLHHAADFLAASWPTLESIDSAVSVIKHVCQPLVYFRDEDDTCTTVDGTSDKDVVSEDMLAIGIQLTLDPVRKLKDVLVALRLSSAMVSPYSADPSAFIRLKEFFELIDEEILGYTFPKVVTEFHAHGVSCAADIRLSKSEYRALLAADRIEVMSNVVTNSLVNALSLMIDDAAVFLAKVQWQQQPKPSALAAENGMPSVSAASSLVVSDDVCIIDIGHFNSIFRTSDGSDRRYPKIDIQVECNIVHIRTCHDSLQALVSLVQQLLDHTRNEADEDGSTPVPSILSSTMSSSGQAALFESSSSEREPEGGQYIPTLLDEAMSELSPQGTMVGSVHQAAQVAGGHRAATTVAQAGLHTSMAACDMLALSGINGRDSSKSADEASLFDDDFYLVEPFPTCEEPRVELLGGTSEPLRCRDYFERPLGRADLLKAPPGTYPDEVEYRYTLQNLSVIWHLYGGDDFGTANTHGSLGRRGLGSLKMGKAARRARGGRCRDIDNLIELQLSRLRAQHELYSPDAVLLAPSSLALEPPVAGSIASLASTSPAYVSRTCLLLNDVEVRDRLQTSSIDKLLYVHSSDKLPKQTHANAILLKIICFKAEPAESADEECNIRVSVQPLRLNLDQDAILFMHSFFTKAASSLVPSAAVTSDGRLPHRPLPASLSQEPKASMPVASAAVAAVAVEGTDLISEQASLRHVVFDEMSSGLPSSPVKPSGGLDRQEAGSQSSLFIKKFEFTPDLYLRLDYVGKGFSGHGSGSGSSGSDPAALPSIVRLVAGLAHLNRVELRLRELRFRHGILGVERLLQECLRSWQHDLRDQLAVVVGGVGPASSLVQIYNGVRDLFLLPLEQYKKDGRIAFGLRRGANAFGISTAAAFLELTNTAVQAVLVSAELVFDLLSPTPAAASRRTHPLTKKRRAPPADVRQGLVNAAEIVTDGVCDTTSRIVSVATVEHSEKGLRGAVGGVLRQLPTVAVQPVIIVAKGASEMLLAARNQLDPDALREERNKWRHRGDAD